MCGIIITGKRNQDISLYFFLLITLILHLARKCPVFLVLGATNQPPPATRLFLFFISQTKAPISRKADLQREGHDTVLSKEERSDWFSTLWPDQASAELLISLSCLKPFDLGTKWTIVIGSHRPNIMWALPAFPHSLPSSYTDILLVSQTCCSPSCHRTFVYADPSAGMISPSGTLLDQTLNVISLAPMSNPDLFWIVTILFLHSTSQFVTTGVFLCVLQSWRTRTKLLL